MFSSEMEEIVNDFLVEGTESLDSLDQKFVELEKSPGDTSLLNDIFRSVHTIKGAAGFLGFTQMVSVTHVTEDVLNKLRKGEMLLNAVIMDAILHSVDMIKVLMQNIRDRNTKEEDIAPIVELLKEILAGNATDATSAPAMPVASAPLQAPVVEPVPSVPAPPVVLSEPPVASAPPQEPAVVPAAPPVASQAAPQAPSAQKDKEQSIRVDIDRLDNVLNLAGELVLSRNRMMRLAFKFNEWKSDNELVGHLDEAVAQMDLVTTDLQLAVMKMRMQPVAKVFNKFPRMVRDLCRQNGKDVELVIKGEETELDKTVIEEIGDPLVHLIRNSMDHGLEMPDDRVANGKPRQGTLTLAAYQEGRNIIVSVSDDGKGIDPAAIKKSAFEKGLITAEDVEKMPDKDALGLIFIPGFSTAKKVSDISGRGVGMDVVKTNISRINGAISIDSVVGKGTTMCFRLPLTLAIIPALTVESGGEIYGIPLSTVIENIRVSPDDIKTVKGREVIHIRDNVFPVLRLSQLVRGIDSTVVTEWKYVVIVAIGERKFGLLVDKLHGQEEIVMKSMGEYLRGTEGIAGACITGDGNVILILDVNGLIDAMQTVSA